VLTCSVTVFHRAL